MRGVPGLAGRTVAAVVLTLDDATRSGRAARDERPGAAVRRAAGGQRGARARARGLRLRGYGYVPGVRVSGVIPRARARFTLMVGGRAAAHGRLTFSRRGVTGVLDGVPVRVGARSSAGAASSSTLAASRPPGAARSFAGPSPLRPPALGSGLSAPVGR